MRIENMVDFKSFGRIFVVVGGGLALAACSSSSKVGDPFAGTGSPVYKKSGEIPKGGGRRHLGKPYSIAGRKFYPRKDPTYNKVGIASWYGKRFHRRATSNGEWYDMNYLSAAHPTLPLPSYAKVTNVATGKTLVVRVNDRGPFVGNRIIDLSRASAEYLGTKRKGTAKVRVEYIGPAPLNDKGVHLAAMNRELARGTPKYKMIARANGNSGGGETYTRVATANPQPYAAANGYFVQVGAFGQKDNANRVLNNAQQLGNTVISPVNGSYGTIYRVRIGPLQSQSQAVEMQQRAVSLGHYDARVVIQ
ncbi:Septum-associated rare lipoprotein A [hydrothermal vent metagenome]|uniref:Septum-associated rare lipoprotein A n=1 Tax=hydrothermal vent metagenome TaxID=652676 RepID=A0A3B0R5J9_9ZZZZ